MQVWPVWELFCLKYKKMGYPTQWHMEKLWHHRLGNTGSCLVPSPFQNLPLWPTSEQTTQLSRQFYRTQQRVQSMLVGGRRYTRVELAGWRFYTVEEEITRTRTLSRVVLKTKHPVDIGVSVFHLVGDDSIRTLLKHCPSEMDSSVGNVTSHWVSQRRTGEGPGV